MPTLRVYSKGCEMHMSAIPEDSPVPAPAGSASAGKRNPDDKPEEFDDQKVKRSFLQGIRRETRKKAPKAWETMETIEAKKRSRPRLKQKKETGGLGHLFSPSGTSSRVEAALPRP